MKHSLLAFSQNINLYFSKILYRKPSFKFSLCMNCMLILAGYFIKIFEKTPSPENTAQLTIYDIRFKYYIHTILFHNKVTAFMVDYYYVYNHGALYSNIRLIIVLFSCAAAFTSLPVSTFPPAKSADRFCVHYF